MSKEITPIIHETRKIKHITLMCDTGWYCAWSVGGNGVTEIRCYGEPSDMAEVPWFAIFAGEEVPIARVRASNVIVEYEKEGI